MRNQFTPPPQPVLSYERRQPPPPTSVYARNSIVTLENGTELPARCVHCNAPGALVRQKLAVADREHRENLFLLRLIPYGGLLRWNYRRKHRGQLQKTVTIQLGLCPRHRLLRMLAPFFLPAGIIAAIGIFRLDSFRSDYLPLMVIGAFAAIAAGLLLWAWHRRTVKPIQITPNMVTLAGAGRAFIQSLPSDPRPAAAAASAAALTAAIRRRTTPKPPTAAGPA